MLDSGDRDQLERLSETAPDNPFLTPAWGDARQARGREVLGFALEDREEFLGGALATRHGGRLRRFLEIESAPAFASEPELSEFWNAIQQWCRDNLITDLVINSFASGADLDIPSLAGEKPRVVRWEFVLPLRGEDLRARLRKSHRNRVNRGAREGLEVRRATSIDARDSHMRTVFGSRQRREERGESVGGDRDPDYFHSFVKTGAGEYFQALSPEGEVLSSILVLKAPRGAYTHSSGTLPEGRERSAAHFLRYEMSRLLQEDGLDILYMGGVQDPDSGLAEYKRGFGADVRRLEKVRSFLGSAYQRKVSTVVGLLKDDPAEIARTLAGRVEHSCAFATDVRTFPKAPPLPDGYRFAPMSLEEVLELQNNADEMAPYARRFRERTFCDAWGVWIDGELAHVSWMIPHEHDVQLPVRNLRLRKGEAEITHAITPIRFRGRGLFPLAIQQLMEVARERGYSTVWAIAAESNVASQRAIMKAGFARHGDIYRWIFDYLPGAPYLTWRGHRLRGQPGPV